MSTSVQPNDNPSGPELLARCGWVLGHPLLSKVVDAAPTSRAADNHVMDLGLTGRVARDVRDAVRLRDELTKQVPGAWEWARRTTRRPAKVARVFEPSHSRTLGQHLYFEVARHFGDVVVNTANLPLLLRDFSAGHGDWTSFDGRGKFTPIKMGISRGKWEVFPLNQGPLFARLVWSNNFWGLDTAQDTVNNTRPFDLQISLGHTISLAPSGIPWFWKIIEILRNGKVSRPYTRERIRLMVPEDVVAGDRPRRMGHMSYEHIVPYGKAKDGHPSTLSACAEYGLRLQPDGCWDAEFFDAETRSDGWTPSIISGADAPNLGADSIATYGGAMSYIMPTFKRIMHEGRDVALDSVVEASILERPPTSLIDLLMPASDA